MGYMDVMDVVSQIPLRGDVQMSVDLILLLAATVLLGLRAFGVGVGRVDFGWLGLALFILTYLI